MNIHGLLDSRRQAILWRSLQPGCVCAQTQLRAYYSAALEPGLLNLSIAHPDVLASFAAEHSSENTANTSALLGAVNTLCAITAAVRNRSYVIAAAVTSESGRLSQSISATLASNAVITGSFLVMGAIEVLEITWEPST